MVFPHLSAPIRTNPHLLKASAEARRTFRRTSPLKGGEGAAEEAVRRSSAPSRTAELLR